MHVKKSSFFSKSIPPRLKICYTGGKRRRLSVSLLPGRIFYGKGESYEKS